MLTQLTKKAGEFKAHCRMPRWVDVDEALAADPAVEGTHPGRWNRKLNRNEIRIPCRFETTDRAVFETHMRDLHAEDRGAKRQLMRVSAPPIPVPVKLWKLPGLKVDGQPLSATTAARLKTCSSCDLHGQVENAAGELWWDEHVKGCAIAMAGAAS